MTSKPNETDSQTNIYIEVVNRIYGKTKSMLDWPLYTPSPNRESIKWPVQVKPLKKQNLCWTGHFIPPPPTENASIKWPVQVKPLKKQVKPPPPTENASNTLFFERGPWGERGPGRAARARARQNLCWTGHFIEKKISLERGSSGWMGSWAAL